MTWRNRNAARDSSVTPAAYQRLLAAISLPYPGTVCETKATLPPRSMSYKLTRKGTHPWLRISPIDSPNRPTLTQRFRLNRESRPPSHRPAHAETTLQLQAPELQPLNPTLRRTISAISTPPLRRTPTRLPAPSERNNQASPCTLALHKSARALG